MHAVCVPLLFRSSLSQVMLPPALGDALNSFTGSCEIADISYALFSSLCMRQQIALTMSYFCGVDVAVICLLIQP